MRIRKHAKISPLIYATSSLKPGTVVETHVCQLNQSPWDVMCFSPSPPPPPCQDNGSDISAGNGSSGQCVSVVDRKLNTWRQSEYPNTTQKQEAAEQSPPQQITLCCKTDGKSWQCRREASKGHSLCEHHLSLVKSYSNSAHHPTKKSVNPAGQVPPPRRPRPKKAPASTSSSNPHEFYYYSGFGPRWGKKRGETDQNSNNTNMPRNGGVGHDNGIGASAASQISEDDFDYFDYEDDDEDEEENRDNGKKRVRKPIKARSLKSLM